MLLRGGGAWLDRERPASSFLGNLGKRR